MAIERLFNTSIRDQVRELITTEDLVIEAVKDLVKDELKGYIRARIERDDDLKEELREAIQYYFSAKARSLYAELKATRGAARLGIALLPDDLQEDFSSALVTLFEKELVSMLDRAL